MTTPPPQYPGLSAADVAARVQRGEVNDYKIQIGRTYWQIVRDNIFNLFNIVLAALGGFMIWFGDYTNLLFASFSVVLNSIVGLLQEISAKRALERLAAMSIQQVKVWRDARLIEIPVNQIVKDDVMPVEPGDRIAVDGRVIVADALEMNEALLTGESDSVLKEVDQTLYSGSFVIAGSGVMIATQVGANSTINKLAATAKAYRQPLTPTQRQINVLVEIAVVVMLLFGPMTVIAGVVSNIGPIEVVRNAVVLVTSMVPQGLVLVTTISLTLGALAISRYQTLVQRVNAVESMANVNVLCFDKTGTLTRNQLAVTQIIPLNGEPEESIRKKLQAYVNSLANLNRTAGAIAAYVGDNTNSHPALEGSTTPIKQAEIAFSSARKWGAVVFANQTFVLGAPERVLDSARDERCVAVASELATQGQRVLAFAQSAAAPKDGKLDPDREALALIVMSDQVRTEIRDTIRQFADLDVELKVISGDNLETVRSIAQEAGMTLAEAYTGDQIEAMSESELMLAARNANVFARIEPETKRKIIRALKAQGRYVAMVGDGVNDVPALKEANMAVAMNDGAQIAKDVADIVLLNNAMTTLPLAFERGKLITQKIFGTTRLFLTKNFYTVLAFIFIGFMALPFSTTPILISWLTFGVVNIPGGLVTFGLLRPAKMHSFQRDVVRYVVAGVLVGAVAMSVLYAFIYLLNAPQDRNPEGMIAARDTARSVLFVFMTLYGLLVFWNMMGIDPFRPDTLREHWRTTLLGIVLTLVTLIPPFYLPQIFEGITAPDLVGWLAVIVTFGVALVALNTLLRNGRLAAMVTREPAT